ncbi:hypothetical protein EJ04DRAFT_67859 [Polyplosphaeria fusca]|uniref:DNA-directed RNA polymerase III subunit n=1 Tax=Polyplosphaeria fusca TaxID=682080 RepID=A0A9P4V743_9PLEO|nr:hypothetical protein EJ04DRAFT_67859 [Polyplosphaeria fusca]
MAPGARGGRGGRGGARGASARPAAASADTDFDLDKFLTGAEGLMKKPSERFPEHAPPLAAPPTDHGRRVFKHMIANRERLRAAPFYTQLDNGRTTGLKRKRDGPVPTEASLFNTFSDNQTYSSKYYKVRRRLPEQNTRPYVKPFFPRELGDVIGPDGTIDGDDQKKRKVLKIAKGDLKSRFDRFIEERQARGDLEHAAADDEDDDDDDKADKNDGDDEDEGLDDDENEDLDKLSQISTDSEESDDDYNAELYFDNGEGDDDDDPEPYDNPYE